MPFDKWSLYWGEVLNVTQLWRTGERSCFREPENVHGGYPRHSRPAHLQLARFLMGGGIPSSFLNSLYQGWDIYHFVELCVDRRRNTWSTEHWTCGFLWLVDGRAAPLWLDPHHFLSSQRLVFSLVRNSCIYRISTELFRMNSSAAFNTSSIMWSVY